MGKDSKIAWTNHTFSPWWSCTKVSDGCKNCYAETLAARWGFGWGPQHLRTFADKHWAEPLKWNRAAESAGLRARVFCGSMCDVFEGRDGEAGARMDEQRSRLWKLIEATPALDWLLLTKRPENIRAMLPTIQIGGEESPRFSNVWLGTTVENQAVAEDRIKHLLRAPAAVHFLSCEPLLGSVDLSRFMWPLHWHWDGKYETPEAAIAAGAYAEKKRQALVSAYAVFLDWVIVGGESGPKARPFHVEWARSIVQQCKAADVACFVKQLGANTHETKGNAQLWPDGIPWDPSGHDLHPLLLRAGADPSEWPDDLRVRQLPRVPHAPLPEGPK
jgi:protein gp37